MPIVGRGMSVARRFALGALGAAGLLLLCAPSRAESVAVSTAAAAADEEPIYVYNASSRDPFVPLAGGAASVDMSGPSTGEKETGSFSPSSLELKGILRTRTGRWAMLSGPAGDRYVVENGKIHDSKKKPVEGYVGIIKEKALVLIGPNNQVTELKLKRDQQEDQTKPK
jgi:hypothetical protein